MPKVDPVHTYAARFREVRRHLGLTQKQMAGRLFVSQNYVAQIESGRKKAPSAQLLAALESLRRKHDSGNSQSIRAGLKTGGKAGTLEEPRDVSYGQVASRIPPDQRKPSTRAECEAYFATLMERAEASGNANAFPVVHDRLKKKFPLDEWDQEKEAE